MKTERRHDLKHNVLDNELAKIVDFFREYGNRIFWAVMILAALVLAFLFARTQIRKRNLETRREYLQLQVDRGPSIGEQIADWTDYADSTRNRKLAGLALVRAGDGNLDRFLTGGEEPGETYLARAEDLYKRVLADFADQALPVAMAQLGLGTVALNRNDLDQARSHYQAVLAIRGASGTPVAAKARNLIEQLPSLAEPVAFVTPPPPPPDLPEDATTGPDGDDSLWDFDFNTPDDFRIPSQAP